MRLKYLTVGLLVACMFEGSHADPIVQAEFIDGVSAFGVHRVGFEAGDPIDDVDGIGSLDGAGDGDTVNLVATGPDLLDIGVTELDKVMCEYFTAVTIAVVNNSNGSTSHPLPDFDGIWYQDETCFCI